MAANPSERSELGALGEAFVATWLQRQGWQIVERQWHCRWGELDLVATHPSGEQGSGGRQRHFNQRSHPSLPLLTFVEVKTRSRGNWDANGLMAVTARKQRNVWQAAQLYLTQNPQWAEAICRFDVALVTCRLSRGLSLERPQQPYQNGYSLVLQDYIENAFDGF